MGSDRERFLDAKPAETKDFTEKKKKGVTGDIYE